MKKKTFVFGASGHGKVVVSLLLDAQVEIEAVLDDHPAADYLLGVPVLPASTYHPAENDHFIVAIGNNRIRKKVVESHSFSFSIAASPTASISKFAVIGEGSVLMPQAVVNAGAVVGQHCIVNSGAVVEHDCRLDDFVHISPNASLAGHVRVGEGTQIGIGACVIQSVTIGKWVTVGAGAVILKDIPDYAVVVGNPGKIIRYHAAP